MKKSILILIMIAFMPGTILAKDVVIPDGYWWEQIDEDAKRAILMGFVSGHRLGEYDGVQQGYIMGIAATLLEFEKTTNNEIDFQIKSQLITKLLEKKFSAATYKMGLRSVYEVDGFYKTYPLCRSTQLDLMLFDLIKVWRNDENKKTYKEVADKCTEQK